MRASLLILFAACSGASTGPATVVLHDNLGSPLGGAQVLAHHADGTLEANTVTALDGTAAITVDDGGMVTVVSDAVGGAETIVGVEPGDTLTFGLAALVGMRTYTVTLPPSTLAQATYTGYAPGAIDDGASNDTPELLLDLTASTPPSGDVLAVASDGTSDQVLVAHGIDLTASSYDVSQLAWEPAANETLTVTGLPSDVTAGQVTRTPTDGGVELDVGFGASWTGTADHASVTYPVPGQVGDGAHTEVVVSRARADGRPDDVETIVAPSTATSFDASPYLLPRWRGPVTFDLDTATLTWALDGSGTVAPIAIELELGIGAGNWRVLVPGDRTSFTLPDTNLLAGRAGDGNALGAMQIGSQGDDYAAYRARAFAEQDYLGPTGLPHRDAPYETAIAPASP